MGLTAKAFTIGFDPEFEDNIGLVDNARNQALLQTKLAELGHPGLAIKFIKAERPANWGQTPAAAPEPAPVAEPAPVPSHAPVASAPPPVALTPPAAPAPKPRAASAATNKDDFKNDPLIAKALEVFKGQIIEVGG